MINNN